MSAVKDKTHLMRFCESTGLIGVSASLPFSSAVMLEQLSQAPEHLLFPPQGSRITMNKFCHNRANMELGAKEGSALYPERFQAQQSQTHSLHSCMFHVHVGLKQTHSLMRPAGIIF